MGKAVYVTSIIIIIIIIVIVIGIVSVNVIGIVSVIVIVVVVVNIIIFIIIIKRVGVSRLIWTNSEDNIQLHLSDYFTSVLKFLCRFKVKIL